MANRNTVLLAAAALLAALGVGFLGYYLGLRRGQAYRRSVDNSGHGPR